ncbi:MAG: rod shape-determining protein MreD [candidate division Zixibacteria bacterium RBG_16_50_21]|nr:MAG: rod shape-determining protein MreD [candidate division Zixibacteria bacterium RBG_16_50_21]
MKDGLFKEIAYSKILTFLTLYLVTIIYESLFSELLRVGPARLDVPLLLLIYVTLTRGTKDGIVFAFGLGLLQDALAPLRMGIGSLVKVGLAYAIGQSKESLYLENLFSKVLVILVAALMNDLMRYVVLYWQSGDKLSAVLIGSILPTALYTSGVAGLAMFLAGKGRLRPEAA